MIRKVRANKLRNSELLQFLNDVIKLCDQFSTEPMKLAAVIAALVSDSNFFEQLFKLDEASPITQELITLDDRRDDYVMGIHMVIEGYTHHFNPAMKSAANALLNSMDNYGKHIYNMNYQAETSTINSLLDEWTANSVLAAAVTTLTLGAWATELKAVNKLFNDKYLERVNEKGSAPQVKLFEIRKKAIATYRNLVQQIESRNTLAGDQTYTGMINSLNALVVKYNLVADSHTEKTDDSNES